MAVVTIGANGAENPEWYQNLPAGGNTIYGYGMGKTDKEALDNAYSMIAGQIQSVISERSVSETREVGDSLHKRFESRKESYTAVTLSGAKPIKHEYDKRKKIHFRAVSFDNTPPEQKMIRLLKAEPCRGERQNPYLAATSLIREINAEAGVRCAIGLKRSGGLWCLTYGSAVIPLTDQSFFRLMTPVSSDAVRITPSGIDFQEGESFFFTITCIGDGYLSLLGVSQNGESFRYFDNRRVFTGEMIVYPDTGDEQMTAAVSREGKAERDLYLAILGSNQLQLGRIEKIGTYVRQDEWNRSFDEVIAALDGNDFCSVLVTTRPNARPGRK